MMSNNRISGIDRDVSGHYENECSSGSICPNLHEAWISLFFDGTGNNRYQDAPRGTLSNIAKLYLAHKDEAADGIEREYFIGVGTRYDEFCPYTWVRDSMAFGGGFGAGGKARIDDALNRLSEFFERHINVSNRNVALFGFSRGAALARYMAYLLVHHGVKVDGHRTPLRAGKDFTIRFLGIFDTVGSFYFPGTDFSPSYDFDIPKEVQKVVHFVAAHERRSKFDLQSIRNKSDQSLPPNWVERIYPGMHSDVGGGYAPHEQGRDGDLAKIILKDMYDEAVKDKVKVPFHSWEYLSEIYSKYDPEYVPGFEKNSESKKTVFDFLYQPSPGADEKLKKALEKYRQLVTESSDLTASLHNHERLYYRWLKHCIDRGSWPKAVHDSYRSDEEALLAEVEALRARVNQIRRDQIMMEMKRNRSVRSRVPEKSSGEIRQEVELWVRETDEYKKLEGLEGKLKRLTDRIKTVKGSIEKVDHAFLQLKQEYDRLQWLVYYHENNQYASWPPPSGVTIGNDNLHSRTEGFQIRPLSNRERQIYQWMNEPPLPDSVIQMFDQWIHDSVAHTPDPLGDSYFAARDIFYQKDGPWQESLQVVSA